MVALPEYLEKVWEVVGREALEQVLGTAEARARNGAAGALEEDSRLTALFLWTMQSTGDGATPANAAADEDEETDDEDEEDEAPRRKAPGYSLPFDVARRFAQPLGVHLDDWESRIIKTEKGVVRAAFRLGAGQAALWRVRRWPGSRRDGCRIERQPPTRPLPRGAACSAGTGAAARRYGICPSPASWMPGMERRRWIGSTPPCCYRLRAAARRCATC